MRDYLFRRADRAVSEGHWPTLQSMQARTSWGITHSGSLFRERWITSTGFAQQKLTNFEQQQVESGTMLGLGEDVVTRFVIGRTVALWALPYWAHFSMDGIQNKPLWGFEERHSKTMLAVHRVANENSELKLKLSPARGSTVVGYVDHTITSNCQY